MQIADMSRKLSDDHASGYKAEFIFCMIWKKNLYLKTTETIDKIKKAFGDDVTLRG